MKLALITLALVACSAGDPGPGIDVDRALAHARALVAIGPRAGETPGAKTAAAYVAQELPGAARAHVGTVELPAIEVLGATYRHAHRTLTTDPNIVARYGPATGKALLVMAHYDTVRVSPGALDNAAAVGVLLELGQRLAKSPPAMPVIIAITAREEDGLIGAEALAASLGPEIDFAIALDLIGGDGDLTLNGAGMLIGGAEMHWLADAADRAGVTLRAPLAHRVISRWWPQAERSDHGPFTRRGIRAVHFYHRGHDGELIDRAYHTKLDRFERIERAAVDEIGRLLYALTTEAPPTRAGDAFWIPQLANVVVPRWTLVVFELFLILAAIVLSIRVRRERARGGAGLLAGLACTALAFIAVYALERIALAAHPLAWLHAPAYFVIAEALVLAGIVGLASRVVARIRPWIGARRYLVVAIVTLLVFGVLLLAIGAAELAWIWLVPAVCASAAPFVGRAKIIALVPTLLPALLVLAPSQLREAAWNGFASRGMPLVGWIA
ncbi:MAG: M28 family metallopeptidase, partial [Myxococcota bacterium]|nr:M28 family metallopeptidase [Myxococcota bacterium]